MMCQQAIPGENSKLQHKLPEVLTEVSQVIGLPATMQLVKEYGGSRVFVPKHMNIQHKLANLLGIEQARRLSHYFGGETIGIARAASVVRAERNQEIARRYDAGERVRSLAREYGITERQVYSILAKTV